MRSSKFVRAVLLGAVMLGVGSRSEAAVLQLQDSVTGTPGSVVDFFGTLTNDGIGTLFVSGDSVTASPQLTVDDSPFLLNVPPSIAQGATVGPLLMLRVNISPAAVPGTTYSGTLTALGGSFQGAVGVLDDETFEVIVRSSTAPVPEPATLLLAVIGTAASALRRRRR